MNRQHRCELIRAIEDKRQSKVIAYVTGDRGGVGAQIGGDADRPLYRHLRPLGANKVQQVDLFLYSRGGSVDVPWSMISTLREYCEVLNVLVPFRAQSAATMLALGADTIVMGKKGQLGPIDPILTRVNSQQGTAVTEAISVEDVMAYIAFIQDRAGLTDQAALATMTQLLADKLDPWVLGSVYRTHSHIRSVARSLLGSHREPLDELRVNAIVELLAEKIYSHGHAIGRREASEKGLRVEAADTELDELMWQLFEGYADLLKLDNPVDPLAAIPEGQNSHREEVILACIESQQRLDVCQGQLVCQHVRGTGTPNVNVNIGLNWPDGMDPQQVPSDMKQFVQVVLEQALKQLLPIVQQVVAAELARQLPPVHTTMNLVGVQWQDATSQGI